MNETAFKAALKELEAQRDTLGARAASFAAKLAQAEEENARLRAGLTVLENEKAAEGGW